MMLLSPDYKQRISSNPNGLDWSNDETKYGQKMLEKMGWKKGKGLGANEDGITNHLKVSQKSDKKGFGCAEAHTDKWLDRLDEYEAILAQLNGASNSRLQDEPSEKDDRFEPLSKKSEGTRNRVHYSKFTKGKDLSLRSETDLDCIFGGKREKRKKDKVIRELGEEGQNSPEAGEAKQFGVITTTSSTNLQDYFAQKMASLRRSKSDTQLCDDKNKAKNASQPESFTIDGGNAVIVSPLKKKKKKAKIAEGSSELVELAESVDNADKSSDDQIGKAKKRKKKTRENLDQSNSASDAVATPGDSNEKTAGSSKKRKKKRKDGCGFDEDDLHSEKFVEDQDIAVFDSTADKSRQKKRKKCVDAEKTDAESSKTSDTVRSKKKNRTKS